MRNLTESLLAAQRSANRKPCVKVTAKNIRQGAVNLRWERLYTGAETDSNHAAAITGNGTLIRVRATPAAENRKLYLQRVTSPGAESNFSQWIYFLNQYNVMAATVCALGNEVSVILVKTDGEIRRYKSPNDGASWTLDTPGYAPTGATAQIAAAYKPNGDLGIFFTDANNLYVIRLVGGVWQVRSAWDKSTGELHGTAVVYDGDWKLLVSGQEESGNFRVWSLVYGDGGEIAAGEWSGLKAITTAASDGQTTYGGLFLDKADSYRAYFSERYSGEGAYNRIYQSHTLPGTAFTESRWTEPEPVEIESAHGPAPAHDTNFAWLSLPGGVWRAQRAEKSLDLSGDVTGVRMDLATESGRVEIELRNDKGQYAALPSPLGTGGRIYFSPGYRTSAGEEYSEGLSFTLEGYEHYRSPGQAGLTLLGMDGWEALRNWTARYQLRWNQPDGYGEPVQEANVKEILEQVLARAGLELETLSESTEITAFYPDFTVHAGVDGKTTIQKLLSFVPDVIFLEGETAYLVNPQPEDVKAYSYGTGHAIVEGRYRKGTWKTTRVRVEGRTHVEYDPGSEQPLAAESFAWGEISRYGDRMKMVEDLNISTSEAAAERGAARLREAEIESGGGYIKVPVNCGQQLFDMIAVTDPPAGMVDAKKRVLGTSLSFGPARGIFEQKINLGEA